MPTSSWPACFSSSALNLLERPNNATVVARRLQANAQPRLTKPRKGPTVPEQNPMVVLQSFPQRNQGAVPLNQEEVGRRWHRDDAWHTRQFPLHPGTLPCRPSLNATAPTLVPRRVSQPLLRQHRCHSIHRPGIPPGLPTLEAIGLGDRITNAQSRHPKQLGEAADHTRLGC